MEINSSIVVTSGLPVDNRMVVKTIYDRNALKYRYLGMTVFVEEDQKEYILLKVKDDNIHDDANWLEKSKYYVITGDIDLNNYYTKIESDNKYIDIEEIKSYPTNDQVSQALSNKANVGDSYTKYESDSQLSIKANVGESYTKQESDAALGTKANSIDVYTKVEIDNALGNKANNGVSYTKAESDARYAPLQAEIQSIPLQVPVLMGTTDPTSNDIQTGKVAICKNKENGLVKLWFNDGGIMKYVNFITP